MSTYGRIWEQISVVRKQLMQRIPGSRADSFEEAKAEAAAHVREIQALLDRWRDLDTKAREASDE